MRLAAFIERDIEAILSQWEVFARALPAGATMDALELRNHASQILEAICLDIVQPQTADEQAAKSKGLGRPLDARETAAQTHALLRARAGFDISQMASEYRALRASVLALWGEACAPEPVDLQDLIRFNEAVDQALTESIVFFSAEVDRGRDLLLGILGHDLRNPLHSIQLTAAHLQSMNAGVQVSAAADRLIKSGARMKALLDDLTDFNRTKLGLGILVVRSELDFRQLLADQMQQLEPVFGGRKVEQHIVGDVTGRWDAGRMHQLVNNLVANALRYGDPDASVQIRLTGSAGEVVLVVENMGPEISDDVLPVVFEPLKRGPGRLDGDGGLGLGLFICREIARAHGGTIAAHSTNGCTTFTVRLPRS